VGGQNGATTQIVTKHAEKDFRSVTETALIRPQAQEDYHAREIPWRSQSATYSPVRVQSFLVSSSLRQNRLNLK
jgi:hypothetical protein